MSVNVRVYAKHELGLKFALPFVLPGEIRGTINYARGRREILAFECPFHDLGANVYSLDAENIDYGRLARSALKDRYQIHYIEPGGEFTHEVEDKKRRKGLLVARHIGAYAELLSRN